MRSIDRAPAVFRCIRALAWCLSAGLALPAVAVTLGEKARESGCTSKPVVVEGTTYKCHTASGAFSYFNVPGAEPRSAEPQTRRVPSNNTSTATAPPSPANFPRVDPATQRGRDDMRRKVLGDELTTEEKLLGEARMAYANGSPPPLPEEQSDAAKYQQRIARLRQTVQLHERNVEALRKELSR
jgi:hypothetical protein